MIIGFIQTMINQQIMLENKQSNNQKQKIEKVWELVITNKIQKVEES